MSELRKITINIDEATETVLRTYMDLTGATLTEALRFYISRGNLVYETVAVQGKKMYLESDEGPERIVLADSTSCGLQ